MILTFIISSMGYKLHDCYESPERESTGLACFGLPDSTVKWGLRYRVDLSFSDGEIYESLLNQDAHIRNLIISGIENYRIKKRDLIIDEVLI